MNFKKKLILAGFVFFSFSAFAQNEYLDTAIYKILDLQDVVVTAQYAPTDSRNAVHEVRALKLDAIEKRGANNLEQLLNRESSIRISQDPILGGSLSLLGMSGQNVKIMIDGVPVIGRQNGHISLNQINLNQIERVEIVEGPLSVSYGTDALAGVINLITKKSQLKKFEFGMNSQIETRGENSFSESFGIRITDDLLFRANVGFDNFSGFNSDTTRSMIWNPKEQIYADGSIRYDFGESQILRYSASWFDESIEDLGDIQRPQFKPYATDNFYYTRRVSHALSHEGTVLGNYYLQTVAGYNTWDRRRNVYRTSIEENLKEKIVGRQDTSSFSAISLRSTFASQFDKQLNFQVGLDARYDDATGQQIYDEETGKNNFSEVGDYAAFGSVRYQPIEKLTFEGGLRYIYNTRYDAPVVPSFNLKYDIAKNWQMRGSYAKGFRSPDIKELFFELVDINHNVTGNPDLTAEKSDNVQLGISFLKKTETQKFDFSVKGFYNDIRDKIEIYEFDETEDGTRIPAPTNSTFKFTYFNFDQSKTRGVNLRLAYSFKNLLIKPAASFIGYYNPMSERFGNVETYTNAVELSNEISYAFPESDLNLSFFSRFNDKQVNFFPLLDEDGTEVVGQRITDGLAYHDFILNKGFIGKKLDIAVGIRNIFDVQNTTRRGSTDGNAHSNEVGTIAASQGRSFFMRVGYKFAQ